MDRHMFLAVPVPEELQAKIQGYAEKVKPILPLKKWTSEGDFHITLNFLGATSDESARDLVDKLRGKLQDTQPFELELSSVGVFGNPKTPRVCWVGIEPSEQLDELYKRTSESCASVGFDTSNRPYRPHITIGKRWGGQNEKVTERLPEPEGLNGLTWQVDEVILYEIHPQRKPKYVVYERFKLREDQ
ncbi:RNA 2',3'-cyclic phosphodiesterase [Pseudalkalibacillus sp. Hm43]|uniref:RNA 2',3'-cyclic phosphodiesterase n=1 Tax=Pseudalkalibacillus sp. Hm43 TaxID=3450742 RepID=UPI003F443605